MPIFVWKIRTKFWIFKIYSADNILPNDTDNSRDHIWNQHGLLVNLQEKEENQRSILVTFPPTHSEIVRIWRIPVCHSFGNKFRDAFGPALSHAYDNAYGHVLGQAIRQPFGHDLMVFGYAFRHALVHNSCTSRPRRIRAVTGLRGVKGLVEEFV